MVRKEEKARIYTHFSQDTLSKGIRLAFRSGKTDQPPQKEKERIPAAAGCAGRESSLLRSAPNNDWGRGPANMDHKARRTVQKGEATKTQQNQGFHSPIRVKELYKKELLGTKKVCFMYKCRVMPYKKACNCVQKGLN